MRFAWLRKKAVIDESEQSVTDRLIFLTYNTVYWFPIVLGFARIIDYRTGFIAFAIIVFARAIINLYRNNALPFQQGAYFPLRSP